MRGALLAVISAAVLAGPVADAAAATTWTVNTTSDAAPVAGDCASPPVAGDCSLRQAIADAATGDTVSLPASATPYAVTLGVIDVDAGITISGAAADTTTIEGGGTSGVFEFLGDVTVSGVTISGGSSSGDGGAIDADAGTITLDNVALSDDTAADGGGVEVTSDAEVTIDDSTLGPGDVANGNDGGLGGAVDNDSGHLTVTDSTISGDSATNGGAGGGISTEGGGSTSLNFDTIAFDSATGSGALGGDLYADNGGDPAVDVAYTIVADGSAPAGGDCNYSGGTDNFSSEGYNLTDGISSTGLAACGFTQTGDLLGDGRLGPLANNGGSTETEAPAAGSPAIGAIPVLNAGCTGTDQRGDARPANGAAGCDIGALETGYGETAPQWSVAHDFSITDNPAPDSLGNSGVWSYEQAPIGDLGDPGDYTLLPNSSTDAGACGNLDSWNVGGGLPVVDFNPSAAAISCTTVTVPAHTVVMHPSGSDYSIVAWTSPVSGTISIAGSFVSMDANGGDGTTWNVDDGATILASGDNDVGGSGNFAPASFAVTSGDTLYFILGPTADATYETTELNLTITEASAPCATSMTVDAVEVLAGCITDQGDGTYLATGDTRFGDGARIVDAGTQTPASLILNPGAHTISIGGGAQSGELEADGVDVATGDLVIDTQGETDPVSGVAGSASVTGLSSVDVTLSGWSFDDSAAVAPTAYLAPTGAGGGAIVDGQLALPAWLGNALKFGTLVATGLVPGVSGELAIQANSSGQLSVVNGGISFKATVLGDNSLQLAKAELQYQRAGDEWTGTADLGFASLVNLNVNTTISDGKLDDLGVDFACATSKICGSSSSVPTLGAVLDVKDIDLNMINLQGISYAAPVFRAPIHVCFPRLAACPPPPPAPQIDGAVILGVFGDRILVGGNFDYLLDGQFSAAGAVGLAPLYGSKFSDPGPLAPGQSASNAVDNLLSSGDAGVELGSAAINFTPPNLLEATGTVDLPPLPFPVQFLKGTISIGIEPPHFTGEGSLTLVVPSYVPLIHGDTFGGVQALISDEAAAAEASLPQYCASVNLGFHTYTACTPKITFLAAFDWATGKVTVDMNGGNIDDYATVPLLTASDASASGVHVANVPAHKQLASFTIKSAKGTPDVELIGPRVSGRRRHLTLANSKKFGSHSGALASVDGKTHTESFLVFVPSGGRWTVKRLRGPRIASVKVTVPRTKLKAPKAYPKAVERSSDLPKGTVSTAGKLTLHYSVPNAGSGTTVDLWAGTAPHGAGGVMIADGLPPSGGTAWKLSGLASGRYYPYAIVSQNGVPVSIQYWPGSVEIVNASAPPTPTGVQASLSDQPPYTLAAGQVYVTWNQVQGASTYAVTATPVDGGKPVVDAVPASQIADVLSLTPGKWSITVASVDSAGDASLASAGIAVTVS